MKGAVIFNRGEAPQYSDIAAPTASNDDEIVMTVKAAAIKNIDKSQASGTHYMAGSQLDQPKVIGGDGVGLLPDGTRVYAVGVTGMVAQKAIIQKNRMVELPAGIDDVTAAALPNAVIGSAMALRFRAHIMPGDTVLINGATGVTGKVAVQMAKYYGAKKVIATGRNPTSLNSLMALGADEIISTEQDDDLFVGALKKIHQQTPINIVIDYLWGHTAELIFESFKGNGSFTHKVRFVSVGGMAGDTIQLSAAMLRSCDIQLSGSGLGSWTKQEVAELFINILPEAFQLAATGKLKIETVEMPLFNIGQLEQINIPNGKRLVVTMGDQLAG